MNWKVMEKSGRGLIEDTIPAFLDRRRKNMKTSVRISGLRAGV
jgi:hypothetical protein